VSTLAAAASVGVVLGGSALVRYYYLKQKCTAVQATIREGDKASPSNPKMPSKDFSLAHTGKAPSELHAGFDPSEVRPWDPQRFQKVRVLQDAARNHGQVHLMLDTHSDEPVAVKQIPNSWICSNHSEFLSKHPLETELPWQDLGCVRFLESAGYPFVCPLRGVFRNETHTFFVYAYASEGDLFSMAVTGLCPGQNREVFMLPVVQQLLEGARQLHERDIAHRDISPENIICFRNGDDEQKMQIKIIDFGMASALRFMRNHAIGKPSYMAPEMHGSDDYDTFLADAFSVGVVIWALLVQDYPWLSTKPGMCKRFAYAQKHGLRAFMAKQKIRGHSDRIGDRLSESLKRLLIGLLEFNPAHRLTLGESTYGSRHSVWDEAWPQSGPGP